MVVERFEGRPSMELTGYSVSFFDAEADLWRQTVDRAAMVFSEIEADGFRWLWERSKDRGAALEIACTRTA